MSGWPPPERQRTFVPATDIRSPEQWDGYLRWLRYLSGVRPRGLYRPKEVSMRVSPWRILACAGVGVLVLAVAAVTVIRRPMVVSVQELESNPDAYRARTVLVRGKAGPGASLTGGVIDARGGGGGGFLLDDGTGTILVTVPGEVPACDQEVVVRGTIVSLQVSLPGATGLHAIMFGGDRWWPQRN